MRLKRQNDAIISFDGVNQQTFFLRPRLVPWVEFNDQCA